MHRRRHRHHHCGPFGARLFERDNALERLETYQRDLEQELADVSDLIERLKQGEQPKTPSV